MPPTTFKTPPGKKSPRSGWPLTRWIYAYAGGFWEKSPWTLEGPPLSQYPFTLYHGYQVAKVTDETGDALPFTREGDYLTVTPQGELSSLTVEYAGSSPMFYSGSQGVCLPGCFPYYPWAGYRKIFYAEPDDGIGLSSFIPRTDLPQSDFTVTVTGGKNLQASLPEVDGTYQGTANGFSLMGGLLESEESGPYRLVTSPLAPPGCQVTEEWLDQLQAAITQEEKKRGLSPAIQLSDYVLFQNNETLLNRAGYGLAIGFLGSHVPPDGLEDRGLGRGNCGAIL